MDHYLHWNVKIEKELKVIWIICILTFFLHGCGRGNNDYIQYEQRAWDLYLQTNSAELMPTVILSNLNRAVELAPDLVSVNSYVIRGNCWSSAGDNERAYQDWTLAIERNPTNPVVFEAYTGRATYWGLRNQPQKALEEADRALALSPSPEDDNVGFARIIRASAYQDLGMHEAASNEYQQAIELYPDLTNYYTYHEFIEAHDTEADPGPEK